MAALATVMSAFVQGTITATVRFSPTAVVGMVQQPLESKLD